MVSQSLHDITHHINASKGGDLNARKPSRK